MHLIRNNIEDHWAEISRRRNILETNIRMSLFHWSKSIDSEKWKIVIDGSLSTKRRNSLESIEPGFFFSSKGSPLYLNDLLLIVKNDEVMPYLSPRKSAILKDMDTINKLRRDAHALVVSEDEIIDARRAFDSLEAEFSPP